MELSAQFSNLVESILRRRTRMGRLSFGSDIVPISRDELSAELARRLNGKGDPNEIWPIKFLRRYLDSEGTDLDALELAIRCTHKPTDLQHLLFRVYTRHFLDANAEPVREFHEFCRGAKLIAVHMSCKPRLHLASRSAKSFGEQEDLRHLIVVGRPAELVDSSYAFDPFGGILTVPAPDNYDGHPQKMAALFRFLGFSGNASCIMKLDDDVRCNASNFSTRAIVKLTQRHNYVGRVSEGERCGIHRWWHFGKCQNNELNRLPYSLIIDCNYAHGPAYFLSTPVINILAKASVYLCQVFQVEYFEDVAVGKILKSFRIYPYHYNFFEAGILYSTDDYKSKRCKAPGM